VIELRSGSATDVGQVRDNNEDELLVANPLFAVADGMGGAAAGEVASSTAINTLREAFSAAGKPTPDVLMRAAQAANRAVWEQAEANPEMRGMGTTLVALAKVDTPAKLAIINVGDSRLYRLHDGDLQQVTLDHNLVAELVAEGRLSKAEAEFHPRRNIMTRALGVEPDVPVDLFEVDAEPEDRFLLCSDGLSDRVSDDFIASVLRRLADPDEAAAELVEEANLRGGNDNITVVIIDVVETEAPAEKGPPPTIAAPSVTDEPAPAETAAAPASPRARRITLRVVLFVLILLILLGGAAAGIGYYARGQYYVGFVGDRITVFQGQKHGVLWFKPTVKQNTAYTADDVEPATVLALLRGVQEPSFSAARQYVTNAVAQEAQAQAAAQATTTTTTTTTVPTTRRPTTSTTKKT
jgi:protein phosphatase